MPEASNTVPPPTSVGRPGYRNAYPSQGTAGPTAAAGRASLVVLVPDRGRAAGRPPAVETSPVACAGGPAGSVRDLAPTSPLTGREAWRPRVASRKRQPPGRRCRRAGGEGDDRRQAAVSLGGRPGTGRPDGRVRGTRPAFPSRPASRRRTKHSSARRPVRRDGSDAVVLGSVAARTATRPAVRSPPPPVGTVGGDGGTRPAGRRPRPATPGWPAPGRPPAAGRTRRRHPCPPASIGRTSRRSG